MKQIDSTQNQFTNSELEQIEEMARKIGELHKDMPKDIPPYNLNIATYLYDIGYRKQSEVASEIFEEIHQRLDSNIECCKITAILTDSKRAKEDYEISKRTLIDIRHYIAELKKKYTEEQNDTQSKGEWLYHKTLKIGGGLGVKYKCSVCGKVTGLPTKYCSNCGTKNAM